MAKKTTVLLASFLVGEGSKRIFSLLSVAAVLGVLVAYQFFDFHPKSSLPLYFVLILVLPFALFWTYLRRYLLIHPRAGEVGLENYFVGLNYESRELRFWRAGDFFFKEAQHPGPETFSLMLTEAMPKTLKTGKSVHVIGNFDLSFGDDVPKVFPGGMTVRLNLSSPYVPEEVIRTMVSIWQETGVFHSSYEEYVESTMGSFLLESAGKLRVGFFSARELSEANYFKAQDRIESFLKNGFKPRLLSNVHSVAYSFGTKE